MNTRYGEMMDMIACLSIYEGTALPAKERRRTTDVQKALELR